MANYNDDRDYHRAGHRDRGFVQDRSRDWPDNTDNSPSYSRPRGRRGYPQWGDTGRDFDQGYGGRRRDTRDDAESGRRYELTFEHGYGAWDAVQDRDLQRGNDRQAGRWGSADPYRPGQDRTQEWLLHDYPWGREQGPRGRLRRRSQRRPMQQGPHTGRGPKGYERSSERIEEDVNERLTRHGRLDARQIRVHADRGELTIEGSVRSRREKRMAEEALETVPGVRDIHNRLRIEHSA